MSDGSVSDMVEEALVRLAARLVDALLVDFAAREVVRLPFTAAFKVDEAEGSGA